MIKVFVWSMRRLGKQVNVGHASMLVQGTYISWWPEGEDIFRTSPIRGRTFEADVRAEGMRPDHTVMLTCLDEEVILDWWSGLGLTRDGASLQGPLQPYELLGRNCSTVVATGLRVGGGDRFATWWNRWNIVWTPSDVLRYASDIACASRTAATK